MAEKQKSGELVAIAGIVAVMLLPVAYILSIGPANWLEDRGYLDQGTYYAYCQPAAKAARYTGTYDHLVWYAGLWQR